MRRASMQALGGQVFGHARLPAGEQMRRGGNRAVGAQTARGKGVGVVAAQHAQPRAMNQLPSWPTFLNIR